MTETRIDSVLQLSHDDGTRKVEVLGDVMKYTIPWANHTEYMTYDEGLYKILTTKGVSPDFRDKRGKIKYHKCAPYLYDLACAYYMGYFHGLDDMESGMERYTAYKRDNDLQVDHADSNKANNTRLNLSLMPGPLNRKKHDLVAKFVWPYEMTAVYLHPGEYRIKLRLAEEMEGRFALMDVYHRCKSAKEFVQSIDDFYRRAHLLPGVILPEENRKAKGKIPHNGSYPEYSIMIQKDLAALPPDWFPCR